MTSRVLVLGGTGRLGSLLVPGLAASGTEVRVLTRDRQRAHHLAGSGVEIVTGDVRSPTSLAAAVAGVDLVISAMHGFEGTGGDSPASVDRDGNINVIDAAAAHGADLVLVSVVGASATSPFEMFRMKHDAETYLAASGVPGTVVRATAFLELWGDLLRQTAGRTGRPIVFGRGQNPINFVSVAAVAALIQRVVYDASTRGQILEIGGPADLTMTELAQSVAAGLGPHGTPRRVPRAILHVIAATAGNVQPKLARHVRAALAMDSADLRFNPDHASARFTDLPGTILAKQ